MAPSQEGSCSWNPILPLRIQCDGGIVSCSDVKGRLNPSSGQQRSARGVTNRRDPLLRARTGILKLYPFRQALRSILLLCIILKAFRRLRTRLFAANGTLFVGSFTCEIRWATSCELNARLNRQVLVGAVLSMVLGILRHRGLCQRYGALYDIRFANQT